MQNNVKIDFITINKASNEFVMYLVEEGPWSEENIENRLYAIQDRIYNTIDVAIEGKELVGKLPEAKSYNIRVQIDLYDNPPI